MRVIFPCAGDGSRFGYKFKPFLVAAGKTTFIELAARSFGPDAQLTFIFRRDQEEMHDVSKRLAHLFPGGRATVCILEDKTSGPLETVQRAVRELGLSGPCFVCDCDHSIDVSPMLAVSPWPTVLVPTWPLEDPADKRWGKARLGAGGAIVELCEKQAMEGGGVVGRIGCYGFADVSCLLDPACPTTGDFVAALEHFLHKPGASLQGVKIHRAHFFGDEPALKDFQASRCTFFLDVDGTIVSHGTDRLLPGAAARVREWRAQGHQVILTTARTEVPPWLIEHDGVVAGIGPGPRVLVNDAKPQWPALQMAMAVTVPRNVGIANIVLDDPALVVRAIAGGASSASVTLMRHGSSYFVRKHAIGVDGSSVLRRQADDMERLSYLSPSLVPRITNRHQTATEMWFDMEFLDGYQELWRFDKATVERIVLRVLAKLDETVYRYSAPVNGKEWLFELLSEKVFPRLDTPLANATEITIDGVKHHGLRHLLALDLPVDVVPRARRPIHGDMTLENILYNEVSDDVKLIDPAGARHVDARELDVGKLFQSLLGDYELLKGRTDLVRQISDFEFELPHGPAFLSRDRVRFLGEGNWEPGLFFMAVAFVRMVPYMRKLSEQRAQFALLMAVKALTALHRPA
jgi:hypothetical protein